jgi:hypothetical protein
MLFVFLGCSKERNFDEREINLISPEKITGFDPIHVSDMYAGNETGKVYEGLFEFHPLKRPYELMPNLAEALPDVSIIFIVKALVAKEELCGSKSAVIVAQG